MVLLIILIVIIVIAAGWLAIGYFGFGKAMKRGYEVDMYDRASLAGTPWDLYYDEIHEGLSWIAGHEQEEVWIRSEDGLNLCGRLIVNPDANGTVLMFHGYHTHPEIDFSAAAHIYYGTGHNILLIDQRAAGKSEGKYIGFGVLERKDCKRWVEYVTKRFGADHRILLGGLSMGASTVLMACAEDLPQNVCGIVADSAFSSPKDIVLNQIRHSYHIKGNTIAAAIGFWCRLLAGYRLDEMSTWDAIKDSDIPVLFAHGTADSRVPVEMTMKAADLCPAAKLMMITEGAEHGTGFLVDRERYERALRRFLPNAHIGDPGQFVDFE